MHVYTLTCDCRSHHISPFPPASHPSLTTNPNPTNHHHNDQGVVRAERLPDPTEFVGPILAAVKKEYVTKTYGIKDWEVRGGIGWIEGWVDGFVD